MLSKSNSLRLGIDFDDIFSNYVPSIKNCITDSTQIIYEKNTFAEKEIQENISNTNDSKIKEMWSKLLSENITVRRLRICENIRYADPKNIDDELIFIKMTVDIPMVMN